MHHNSKAHKENIPYIEHPELPRCVAEDTSLWRCFSFAPFVALLEHQALHFTRVDRLPDPSIHSTTETFRQSQEVRRALDLMRVSSQAVFANCWYGNLSELPIPWERYGGRNNGVLVRSSIGRLKAALKRAAQKVHLANVLYFDYETAAIPVGNAYLSALHKHASLAREREVRALLLQMGDKSKVFSAGPEHGISVNVDTECLIEEVRAAPESDPWFERLLIELLRRYIAAPGNLH